MGMVSEGGEAPGKGGFSGGGRGVPCGVHVADVVLRRRGPLGSSGLSSGLAFGCKADGISGLWAPAARSRQAGSGLGSEPLPQAWLKGAGAEGSQRQVRLGGTPLGLLGAPVSPSLGHGTSQGLSWGPGGGPSLALSARSSLSPYCCPIPSPPGPGPEASPGRGATPGNLLGFPPSVPCPVTPKPQLSLLLGAPPSL